MAYHRTTLVRFLVLALAALVLCMALVSFATGWLGLEVDTSALTRAGLGRASEPPAGLLWGSWLIQSLALVALFLLIQGRGGAWWMDGLLTGWIGWVFRGPVLVLTLVTTSGLGRDPWWPMSLRWLLVYSGAGLLVSWLARKLGIGVAVADAAPSDEADGAIAMARPELEETP